MAAKLWHKKKSKNGASLADTHSGGWIYPNAFNAHETGFVQGYQAGLRDARKPARKGAKR